MEPHFRFGAFDFDATTGVLSRDGTPVLLGSRAVLVLEVLLRAGGRVVTKDELLAKAWPGTVVEEANLSVQIAALRKALAGAAEPYDWIATVARVGYRFAGPVQAIDVGTTLRIDGADRAVDKPTVAVVPFANSSADAAQEYVADGITDDLIDALSHYRWFRVVARNASFALRDAPCGIRQMARELGVRYLVEGNVRKSQRRMRVGVSLSDVESGKQIWADRFELALTDVFSVQDRIVQQVAGAMEPELLQSDARAAGIRRPGATVTGWDLVRQGTHAFHKVVRDSHLRAREFFREAIAREPDLPEAYVWMARVSAGIVAYGWSADPQADLHEGLAAAFEAIRRDERSPYAHYALAIVSAYDGEPARATHAARRALELNPSFALGHLVLGMAQLFDGHAREAIDALARGLALNAYDPQNFVWFNLLAYARYFSGEYDQALDAAERASSIRPASRAALELMACCHLALGDAQAAVQCLGQIAALPATSDRLLTPLDRIDPQWRNRIASALRRIAEMPP